MLYKVHITKTIYSPFEIKSIVSNKEVFSIPQFGHRL